MNLIKKYLGFLSSRRCRGGGRGYERGLAAVELALTIPLWTTLLLGAGDATYFLLINEKCDRIAYTVTDIVTQYQTVSLANLNDIILSASQIMQPYGFGNNGTVIVSSIYKPIGQTPVIKWQYTGGGTLIKSSVIGVTGGAPTLPTGLTLNDNDNVIISEVFYKFTPLFLSAGLFGNSSLYRIAVYKPRISLLINTPT